MSPISGQPEAGQRRGPIRVVVADAHPLFRDALVRAIRQDAALEVVDDVSDPGELVDAITGGRPDVALVDAALADEAVMRGRGATRLLVLAADIDPAAAHAAVEAGADGYVSKDAEGAIICRAAAQLARGMNALDPYAQTSLVREMRLRRRDGRPALTRREREILVLMATGRTAPAIAEALGVSTATVKTHQQHLYAKLGVADRAAAVAEGMRKGLIE
jgi:two-component system, NarL family, nitrate/nitrite response regulator NarL